MAQTQTALINAILNELNVLALGQDAEAEDAARVTARIPTALSNLSARNIVWIANDDQIEDGLFPHLVTFIAETCAPQLAGRKTDYAVKALAESELAKISRLNRGSGSLLRFDSAISGRRR